MKTPDKTPEQEFVPLATMFDGQDSTNSTPPEVTPEVLDPASSIQLGNNGYYYDAATDDGTFATKPESEVTDAEREFSDSIADLFENNNPTSTSRPAPEVAKITAIIPRSRPAGADHRGEFPRDVREPVIVQGSVVVAPEPAPAPVPAPDPAPAELVPAPVPVPTPEQPNKRILPPMPVASPKTPRSARFSELAARIRGRATDVGERTRSVAGELRTAPLRAAVRGHMAIGAAIGRAGEFVATRTSARPESGMVSNPERRNKIMSLAIGTIAVGYVGAMLYLNARGHDTSMLPRRHSGSGGSQAGGSGGNTLNFFDQHDIKNPTTAQPKAPDIQQVQPRITIRPEQVPSFRMEQGGTIWDHAENLYTNQGYDKRFDSINDLKNEIMRLNHLSSGDAARLQPGAQIHYPGSGHHQVAAGLHDTVHAGGHQTVQTNPTAHTTHGSVSVPSTSVRTPDNIPFLNNPEQPRLTLIAGGLGAAATTAELRSAGSGRDRTMLILQQQAEADARAAKADDDDETLPANGTGTNPRRKRLAA